MTQVLKTSEFPELTEDFDLTVPTKVQEIFEQFEFKLIESNSISVKLEEYQAHLFLHWLAFKGYPCDALLKQKRIKITVNNKLYTNFSFLKYAIPMEMNKVTFSPIFIDKYELCREMKTFLAFLKFNKNSNGSYDLLSHKNFKFSYSTFLKFMGIDTLHMIKFLNDNCYVSLNNYEWLNDGLLPPENLTFKLSSKFFLKLMATEPERNNLELFLIDIFDKIFSIRQDLCSEIENAA